MLPEKWCIKSCKELVVWGGKEKLNLCNCAFSVDYYYYYTSDPEYLNWDYFTSKDIQDYTEITFEDFEKYVLNKTPEIKEDMSYLIKVLNRCNIK